MRDAAEQMSVDELRALQLERLRWTVGHAYSNVAFYREKLDEAGVGPEDLRSLEDLASFPLTLSYELEDGKHLVAYHGSPRSYKEHLAPTTPDHDLQAALAGHQADIFIGGHTHMQMFRRHRRSLVLNPWSVGLAFDHAWPFDDTVHNPPWAEYAIIDTLHGGLNVELHRVPFDVRAFIQITLASGMPHAEWSVGEWTSI